MDLKLIAGVNLLNFLSLYLSLHTMETNRVHPQRSRLRRLLHTAVARLRAAREYVAEKARKLKRRNRIHPMPPGSPLQSPVRGEISPLSQSPDLESSSADSFSSFSSLVNIVRFYRNLLNVFSITRYNGWSWGSFCVATQAVGVGLV